MPVHLPVRVKPVPARNRKGFFMAVLTLPERENREYLHEYQRIAIFPIVSFNYSLKGVRVREGYQLFSAASAETFTSHHDPHTNLKE
jgi:hypothetical protein